MKYKVKGITDIWRLWIKEFSNINRVLLIFLLMGIFSSCGGKTEYKLIEAHWYQNGEFISRNIYDGLLTIDEDNIYMEANGKRRERMNILEKKNSLGGTRYKILDEDGYVGTLKTKWFSNEIEVTDNEGNNYYYTIK